AAPTRPERNRNLFAQLSGTIHDLSLSRNIRRASSPQWISMHSRSRVFYGLSDVSLTCLEFFLRMPPIAAALQHDERDSYLVIGCPQGPSRYGPVHSCRLLQNAQPPLNQFFILGVYIHHQIAVNV